MSLLDLAVADAARLGRLRRPAEARRRDQRRADDDVQRPNRHRNAGAAAAAAHCWISRCHHPRRGFAGFSVTSRTFSAGRGDCDRRVRRRRGCSLGRRRLGSTRRLGDEPLFRHPLGLGHAAGAAVASSTRSASPTNGMPCSASAVGAGSRIRLGLVVPVSPAARYDPAELRGAPARLPPARRRTAPGWRSRAPLPPARFPAAAASRPRASGLRLRRRRRSRSSRPPTVAVSASPAAVSAASSRRGRTRPPRRPRRRRRRSASLSRSASSRLARRPFRLGRRLPPGSRRRRRPRRPASRAVAAFSRLARLVAAPPAAAPAAAAAFVVAALAVAAVFGRLGGIGLDRVVDGFVVSSSSSSLRSGSAPGSARSGGASPAP